LALLERWNLALGMFWVDSSTGELTEVTPSRFRGARAVTFFEDRTAFACVYTDIAPEYGPWDGPMLLKAVSVDSVHRSLVELNEQGLAVGRNPSGIAVATLSPHR
jgi:hypothetical protein